jgi:hypothetical protein
VLNVDEFDETFQSDETLELWDNIATAEYERKGMQFGTDDPNEQSDPNLFEACQRFITSLICDFPLWEA